MPSKRVLALAADKAFAKRMSAGLMAAGAAVETIPTLDELPAGELKADLVVIHSPTKLEALTAQVSARLSASSHLIVIIPTSSLEDTVRVMAAGRVAAVLVADEFEPAHLAAVATRILYGDLFGLAKFVPWGVRVHSLQVGGYQEKSTAIAAVAEFATSIGVRRKYREAIEQCLDEMLMNALYDAPVDAEGKQMFTEMPTKTRISLRMEQKAVVEYACDGRTFALSVRDRYGTLEGETILKYLDKCLHSDQQIDRKAGGAGLGLYIIANAATQFLVSIDPGVATEATCTFDLEAAKVQLKSFGVFKERPEAAARRAAGKLHLATAQRAAVAPSSTRAVNFALGAAIVSVLALIGVVAWPQLHPPPRGTLAISTQPPGATIEIDGAAKGTSGSEPLLVELQAELKYKVVARRDGYEPTVELVTPHEERTPLVLTLKPMAATLLVTTVPPGATVVVDGKELGSSPLPINQLAPGSEHDLHLEKNGYVAVDQRVKVPEPGAKTELQFNLMHTPELSSIRIDSDPPGAELLQNGELLAGTKTPVAEQMLQVGRSYSFTLRLPGYRPATVNVVAQAGSTNPISAKLKRGGLLTIETNLAEVRASVVGVAECQGKPGPIVDCPLENGHYKVRIMAARPFVAETLNVVMNSEDIRHKLDFGFVETAAPELTLQLPGAGPELRRAAFPEGERRITLVNLKSGLTLSKPVRVIAGKTVKVGE